MSETEICNASLLHNGIEPNIGDVFKENSTEAIICRAAYKNALKPALMAHDWNFARQSEKMASVDNHSERWAYCYRYPKNCIKALYIVNPLGRKAPKIPFETATDKTTGEKVIYTDLYQAELVFTAFIDNTTIFDPMFEEVLSYKIASLSAIALTGSISARDKADKLYKTSLSAAKTSNLQESEQDEAEDADWIKGRD